MTGRFRIPGSGYAQIPSAFAAWGLTAGLIALFAVGITGCDSDPPVIPDAGFTLPNHMPADVEGSCIECHARQVNEWLGSSHNYGGGLDGTFQSLELVANYYATHAPDGKGGPRFRQSQLCIACHAPSIALYGADGKVDINATLREGVPRDDIEQPLPGYRRELPYPDNNADLLPPLGRAIEKATLGDGEVAPAQQRLLSFQGITCDSCHKVGAPMDDRFTDPGIPGYSTCDPDDDLDACLAIQMAECEDRTLPFNPRCLRRTRQQDPHGDPYFEHTVATVALPVERFGPVRYGPFSEEEGEVVAATAHGVSDGATDKARNFDRATYPDGTPFEDQPRDEKPFIQSSQFCGACHDVRLQALNERQPGDGDEVVRSTPLEPVHNEPFVRLENLYTEWFQSPLNLHPDQRGDDPDRPWPGNPFRNPDGSARRIVCQDCHMSLHPFAPPGTFPGEYTHGDVCDESTLR